MDNWTASTISVGCKAKATAGRTMLAIGLITAYPKVRGASCVAPMQQTRVRLQGINSAFANYCDFLMNTLPQERKSRKLHRPAFRYTTTTKTHTYIHT